jgi:flagellar hook-associated protein 3 FlgL
MGANGTFSKEDLNAMGRETNELLNEFINIANTRSPDGTTLFAGERAENIPFRVLNGNVKGGESNMVIAVEYVGDIGQARTEISENNYIALNFPGNRVFWAEPTQVIAGVDASSYQVQADSVIFIDNTPIQLKAGDNIHAIIAKINDSNAAVRARLDPVKNSIAIQATVPHQLWFAEGPLGTSGAAAPGAAGTMNPASGTVLRDLGIIGDGAVRPPHNIAKSALSFGGSSFDMIMRVRDALLSGDAETVGATGLRGMDDAIGTLLNSIADAGSKDERVQFVMSRIGAESETVADRNSHEIDLDMAQAITDLKMLEATHRATLQTAARVLQPTLLDFLR